jgi:aminoglycoside phosphotransferase (APT) family kinase protein
MDEIKIDEELVRSLLRDQHPDLAGLEIREVIGGWGNMMWRLGDEYAIRLPRTDGAPGPLREEQRWLPVLASRLPLPIPTPVRVGEPSALFPHTWTVTTWVVGVPGDHTPITRPEAADTLAAFLRALHREAPNDAPVNPGRGVGPRQIKPDFDSWPTRIGSAQRAAAVREVWDDAIDAPEWGGPPVWLHADLHPANVVVADGTLTGVIDFGDMCSGDPATDLAAAWVLLPDGAAPRFFDAYAVADDAAIRRARGWAVVRAIALIDIGRMWEQGLPGGK